jgi:hypothetical protein
MAWEEKNIFGWKKIYLGGKKYNCADNYQQIMSIDIEMFLKHKILYKIEFSFNFYLIHAYFNLKIATNISTTRNYA